MRLWNGIEIIQVIKNQYTLCHPKTLKMLRMILNCLLETKNETEKSGKKKFDNTAIMIVSDMLLTGWDAPIASVFVFG